MGIRVTENEIQISPPQLPPWIELPGDVTANILQRLGAEEILKSAEKVCTTWWKFCKNPAMWRVVDLRSRFGRSRDFDAMCRCAVDRSHGQLVDLSIARFGDDDLLIYIADQSSHLRRLTLASTGDISGTGLTEAVKKLPQLEELHLIAISPMEAKCIEAIGISCPLLKSFTYDEVWGAGIFENNNETALAIARTMPNLHHLRLVEDGTENKGLEAILDGCPHLESLDLSCCYGLHPSGVLRERCSKQIKFLRLPIEPSFDDFDDYFDTLDYDDYAPENEYAADGYHYDYYY